MMKLHWILLHALLVLCICVLPPSLGGTIIRKQNFPISSERIQNQNFGSTNQAFPERHDDKLDKSMVQYGPHNENFYTDIKSTGEDEVCNECLAYEIKFSNLTFPGRHDDELDKSMVQYGPNNENFYTDIKSTGEDEVCNECLAYEIKFSNQKFPERHDDELDKSMVQYGPNNEKFYTDIKSTGENEVCNECPAYEIEFYNETLLLPGYSTRGSRSQNVEFHKCKKSACSSSVPDLSDENGMYENGIFGKVRGKCTLEEAKSLTLKLQTLANTFDENSLKLKKHLELVIERLPEGKYFRNKDLKRAKKKLVSFEKSISRLQKVIEYFFSHMSSLENKWQDANNLYLNDHDDIDDEMGSSIPFPSKARNEIVQSLEKYKLSHQNLIERAEENIPLEQ